MTTNALPNFTPSDSLIIVPPRERSAGLEQPGINRFALFTEDWLQIQKYAASIQLLPISTDNWDTRYGRGKLPGVDKLLKSIGEVRGLSDAFGDPISLKKKIVNSGASCLVTDNPPEDLYTHIVWLVNKISVAATEFTTIMEQIPILLSSERCKSPEERAKNLKLLLGVPDGSGTPSYGMHSTAVTIQKETDKLLKKLVQFENNFLEASRGLQAYTAESGELLNTVNTEIGELRVDVTSLQEEADKAYNTWLTLTISAAAASVGLTILSLGMFIPVAAAIGTGLGIAAAVFLAKYYDLKKKLNAKNEQFTKRSLLATDLSGLNEQIENLGPCYSGFRYSLSNIQGVWIDTATSLSHIVNNYGIDKLGNLEFIKQELGVTLAAKMWKQIGEKSHEFIIHSLVTYNHDVAFGKQFPA